MDKASILSSHLYGDEANCTQLHLLLTSHGKYNQIPTAAQEREDMNESLNHSRMPGDSKGMETAYFSSV